MIDLLVIGAGLSGLMAAHTAAQAGLQVKVVAKGLGTVHWTAGTIDVFGYAPGDQQPIRRPLEASETLAGQHPTHPYALLGQERLVAALDSFRLLAQAVGLPYGGASDPDRNLLLPSPAGAARPTFLAPWGQLRGDLGRPEPMLIVGFKDSDGTGQGMRDFYPELIAENLAKQGYQARAAFLPFRLLTDRQDSNPVQLAQELDDPVRRQRLTEELRRLVQPGERIGLPSVLGLDQHMVVMNELEAQTGAPVFEIPTLPPSVPGVRLFKAFRERLFSLGVRVEAGMEVIGADKTARQNGTGGLVNWVETETSARPLKHRAQRFLLATGGLLGGGFNSDHAGRVWEVVFDLPLTVPQNRDQWFRPSFLDPLGHPVFTGGVQVNSNFQPVDEAGEAIYDNLWAAGNLLADDNPILQRSMEGAAIATGVAAAQAILEG
jgi:glycerol-3-phosphate dehydrogenase subunit B